MSLTPQTNSSWIDKPLIVFFLPYYRRVERFDIPSSVVVERFASLNNKSILSDTSGFLSVSRKRYDIKACEKGFCIRGPYGYRAWTMQTTIAVLSQGEGSVLDVRMRPHWSVFLITLPGLVFIIGFSLNTGFTESPLSTFLLFALFLYVASVVATKIESGINELIVLRIVRDEPLNITY
jgi:hypothetical protein